MPDDLESEMNHRDFTTVLKDGMTLLRNEPGKDGKPVPTYVIDAKSAWWKTHFINSFKFGMMGERLEDFGTYAEIVKYHMSPQMADVLSGQIQRQYDVMKHSIDAKSSETMSNSNNKQTSMGDKYLQNKQERLIDIKGEMGRSISDMLTGKEAHEATK